jgi:hypothetical protein
LAHFYGSRFGSNSGYHGAAFVRGVMVLEANIYLVVGAAFATGSVVSIAVVTAIIKVDNALRSQSQMAREEQPKSKRKFEYSKFILTLVLLTYFVGVYVGVKVVFEDSSYLTLLFAFIGTPTATAIGFYTWKAKAENIVKLKNAHPEITQGQPIDLNNIHT